MTKLWIRLGVVTALSFLAAAATAQDPVTRSPIPTPSFVGIPRPLQLVRAGSTTMDLRLLPQTPPEKFERPELEEPEANPIALPAPPIVSAPTITGRNAPVPGALSNFDGLDFATWGAGHPPDPNGDVGPTHYIQVLNTSIGIFKKSDSSRVAVMTFNTFMSQGAFGNLCDTNNFGDPVVLYDTFEDRWVITDFAFTLDGLSNVINPPGDFQCFAVSKTGDPVTGGWNFYSINVAGGLGDYPKFGIWPDGIYMSANLFQYAAGGSFQNPRAYAFNKAQMYAGSPTVQIVAFDAPSAEFTLLPANARLQAGAPPLGSPNYFAVVWQFTNAVSIYKFHVDWTRISLSTFTGPFIAITPASNWATPPATVPSQGGNGLDTLPTRLMAQNQYTNLGGVESLWDSHTVLGSTASQSAVRVYQTSVTGGTVAGSTTQAFTHNPDAVLSREVPSVAIDRAGDLALGYTTTSATSFPAIAYAGNLVTDPINTISQTEATLFAGTGSQSGNCGPGACIRWGDYTSMSLDPDGCTFWFTNEYFATTGLNFLTRIGAFKFPSCTPVGSGGTIQGTVTATVGGAPISGATLTLGNRTTTTAPDGTYSFASIPAGTYSSIAASDPGFASSAVSPVAVTDSGTTIEDFSLAIAASSACLTDDSQLDLETGAPTNVDLATSPGNAILVDKPAIDQQNTSVTNSGFGVTSTAWAGQTFTAGVTGQLARVDLDLFCSGCNGTTPNLTVSIRATTGATPVPTGADLATATIAGFNSGAGGYFSALFSSPPTLTAGVRYAVIFRAVSNPSAGTYAYTCSCTSGPTVPNTNPYANGQRVTSSNSGSTWVADTTVGGRDLGFVVYMQTGFASSGHLISAVKDSNPGAEFTPTWSTLSWTATTPTNTAVSFQVAASNGPNGPFSFVGPDGTSATFFTTSGASISQFNGKRYLEYKAYLTTTDGTVTPTLDNVTVCFSDTPLPAPDLSLTKSDGGATVAPGGTVAYTLTYANAGGQSATGVVISETVPANSVFSAGASTVGWACSPNGNAGSGCTLAVGGLAVDGNHTATFAVTATNPLPAGVLQLANTASIADDGTHGADPTPGNNTGSDTTPVTGAPDLSLTKSDGGASVAPGGTVSYTLTYANGGNRGASGVVLTETVPAHSTFSAGASTAGWVCTPNGNAGSTCTLAIGSVVAGDGNHTATFAITATTPMPAGVTQLANSASIADDGTNGTDSNPGNNTGSDTTPVTGSVDLQLTNSDGGASVAPGGTVAYTLTYANGGNRGASGVVLTETVPAHSTFNAGASTAGWVCTPNGNAGSTCTLAIGGVVAGDGTHTATFAVTATNPMPAGVGQLSNTASIADDGTNGTDPTPANNVASDTTPITGAPDLSLTKSDGGASVAPGGTVPYTLTYANSGNRNASGVVITETVPAHSTFSAAGSTAGWVCVPNGNAGSTCTLAIGGVTAGDGNHTATFAVTADSTIPAGVTQLSNTATIADDGTNGTDPNPGNNIGSDTTPLLSGPDLAISINDGGITVLPGGEITYTLTYSNNGTHGSTGVVITETVPTHATFDAGTSSGGWSCVPSSAAGSTCTLAVGSLIAGSGNQTTTFAVVVDNPIAAGVTSISDAASIADDGANGADTTPGNNSATANTAVVNGLYYTVTPCRLVDTRNPTGPYGGPALASFTARTFVAAGQCGIPVGATAVAFNITVTMATAGGDLRVYAAGTARPGTSVINYLTNATQANNGIVVLGAGGDLTVWSDQPSGTAEIIIDVSGYFE